MFTELNTNIGKPAQIVDLATIHAQLSNIERATLLGAKDVLNVEEAAMLLGYTPKSVYALTYQRLIPYYKSKGKLYFRKAELEAWMTENRIATKKEIETQAATYVCLKKPKY
jgi:excisionase family DNA binding protein